MPQIINTNIPSLNAQRNLNTSQTALATALQRLSSGLRINSAKDDAAGLAISERFTTQIRGLNQAVRNASDGISLAQTGEGALAEITQNLQRIRELAVQSANATNSDSDRAALDLEVQQRLAEIDRIAAQTSFNGRRLLNGSFGSATFQVGANVGETISLSLNTSVRTSDVGDIASVTSANLSSIYGNSTTPSGAFTTAQSQAAGVAAAGQTFSFTVGGVNVLSQTQTEVSPASGAYTAAVAGAAGEQFTVTLTTGTDTTTVLDFTSTGAADDVTAAEAQAQLDANLADIEAAGYTVTGTVAGGNLVFTRADGQQFTTSEVSTYSTTAGGFANFGAATASVTGAQVDVTAGELDAALTLKQTDLADAGITYTGTVTGGDLQFIRADGAAFDIVLNNNYTTVGGFATANAFVTASGGLTNGTISVDNDAPITFAVGDLSVQVGTNDAVDIVGTFDTLAELADAISSTVTGVTATVADGRLTLSAGDTITLAGAQTVAGGNAEFTTLVTPTSGDLNDVDVLDVASANDAILRVDAVLTDVSNLRSTFGAIQNRFESTIANLTTTAENLTASRSRIQDADFAQETANLTRAQILQQAGVAILAQANALPNNVLTLLR